MSKSEFGIIGLGVMGRSLAKNLIGKGVSLSVYNRPEDDLVSNFLSVSANDDVHGFEDLQDFVSSISQPRKILLMVTAGPVVDLVLDDLMALLNADDIIIDGGNSFYKDTARRDQHLSKNGIHFIGMGISGGEQGALLGPSLMPGGNKDAYHKTEDVLKQMAANDENGTPCVSYLGPDGCGHFIKMIHNGIEYAEMQLLAEAYGLLSYFKNHKEISEIFSQWNKGMLQSYLLGITSEIVIKKEGNDYLIDKVLDQAGSKGTGSWSVQEALQMGIPSGMMQSAVEARYISLLKEQRIALSRHISATQKEFALDIDILKQAYKTARLINHQQGFAIIAAASEKYNWNINLSEVARIWTEGCIIKSRLMKELIITLTGVDDLLEAEDFVTEILSGEESLHTVIKQGMGQRIALPSFSAAWNYLVAMSTENSVANMIQAQRDAFGAHTYKRTDKPFDQNFTTNWTQNG